MNKEDQELFNMINASPKRNQQVVTEQQIEQPKKENLKLQKTNKYKNKKAKQFINMAKGIVVVFGIGTAVVCTVNLIDKLKPDDPSENISAEFYVEDDASPIKKEVIDEIDIEDDPYRVKIFDDEEKYEEPIENNQEIEEQEEFVKGPAFDGEEVYNNAYKFFNNTNYNEYLEKYSKMYGVDYNLMVALFMQESHCGLKLNNPCAVGIGQIEKTDRSGSDMVYNYETGKMEEINYNYIESDEQNVKVSCQMMQYGANKFGLNIGAILTNYNQGITTTNTIVKEIAKQKGCTVEDLKYDTTISDWSRYIRICTDSGDPNYIQNVLSFLGNDTVSFCTNGEKYRINLNTGEYEKIDINDDIYEISHKTK